METIKNKDRIVGVILFVVALAFAIGALTLPDTAAADVRGPKLYPLGLAIILAILSIMLIVTGKGGGKPLTKKIWIQGFLPTIGICILYIALLSKLGFVICTIALMLALFRIKGERKWWLNVVIAIGTAVGIYLLFGKMLNVPLKLMPWFIKFNF